MSVKTLIPDLVKSEGGIPTAAELETAWTALADVDEEILDVLLGRTSGTLIEAYEQPLSEKPDIHVDHDLVGQWFVWMGYIVGTCETLLEKAHKLQTLTENLGDAAHNDGKVELEPPFSKYGGPYKPSKEALEAWGLPTKGFEVRWPDAS